QQNKTGGFNVEEEGKEHKKMKNKVTTELKRTYRREYLNRIDETKVYYSLEKNNMKDIVALMIKEVQSRMETQEMNFTITDGAIEKIAEEGFDPEYGARPLRRSIQTNIEDLLSEELLKGTIEKGEKVRIGLNSKGEFSILK